MTQVSSRAGRGRHPMVGSTQKEFDMQSKSANPTMIVWTTSEIRRYPKKVGDKTIEVVEIWKQGRLHSTSENGWLIDTSQNP